MTDDEEDQKQYKLLHDEVMHQYRRCRYLERDEKDARETCDEFLSRLGVTPEDFTDLRHQIGDLALKKEIASKIIKKEETLTEKKASLLSSLKFSWKYIDECLMAIRSANERLRNLPDDDKEKEGVEIRRDSWMRYMKAVANELFEIQIEADTLYTQNEIALDDEYRQIREKTSSFAETFVVAFGKDPKTGTEEGQSQPQNLTVGGAKLTLEMEEQNLFAKLASYTQQHHGEELRTVCETPQNRKSDPNELRKFAIMNNWLNNMSDHTNANQSDFASSSIFPNAENQDQAWSSWQVDNCLLDQLKFEEEFGIDLSEQFIDDEIDDKENIETEFILSDVSEEEEDYLEEETQAEDHSMDEDDMEIDLSHNEILKFIVGAEHDGCKDKKIDKTVDPCFDFYTHVCPVKFSDRESVNGKLEQLYQNKIKEIHTKHDEFQKQLATYVFNVRKTVDDLLEACDANKTQAIRFVNATTGLQFFEMVPCEMISYAFGVNASLTEPQELYGYFLNVLLSGPREIEFSKSKLGQTLDKKEADFFESFREEVRNKFLETPWLKFRNGTELYLEHLESNLSLFRRDPEMLHAWEVIFDGLKNHSLNCKPNSTLPSFVCAIEEVVRLINEKARPLLEFLMFETVFNAMNTMRGPIFMMRPVQFLTLTDNMARLYGSYGFVVGHEIMHTFYSSNKDQDVLKEHFTNSSQCVQKQYEKTCKEFETSCKVTGTNFTNEEDGSDLAAIRVVYSDFQKNHLHKEKSDIDGVTSEQMFFYALASIWCEEKNNILIDKKHSTPYIRVNALVSQMNEFKEAFQCAEDSRMTASKVEHCAIFGSDAPQTRKTNNKTAPSTKEI
ncbi:unnamed protein product [Caenorhabditis auriculariae]|uniref:Peptidase M13 C-terminal domain-containing protein n=1 Tax=Caenorhabditis auriculariae TaxID=2777116 RepID=A0A8S1HCP7_9PELO|nr:unnamed protein product [Caenorhabditis auriculariae]